MSERRLEMDAPALKALAHPLRVQILRILQLRRRASVTSLAAELGETTGATSYHLRQLARHGFVEQFDATEPEPEPASESETERPRKGGRRQQWWRMAAEQIHMSGFDFLTDENTREAAGFLLREYQADRSRRLANWYATATRWPAAWQRASSDMDGHIELSPKQTRELADELAAVVERYRGLEPGRGARLVDIQYAVFPAETGVRP